MIEMPSFIDLHTHTRYPDKNNFPILEIEKAAQNGGYSHLNPAYPRLFFS